MKYGLKVKIAEKSGLSKSFITRILSRNDVKKPSWTTSKILGFVTKTDPVLWADKNIPALESALADVDPSQLEKYDPDSTGATA